MYSAFYGGSFYNWNSISVSDVAYNFFLSQAVA